MPIVNRITAFHGEMTEWRRDLHAHPEIAFEEHRTAAFVAAQLESFGIAVTRGIGRTGIVGTLKSGSSSRAIGLRADMDALPMAEANDFAHASTSPGKMHACGHDGHTTMLLGAAKYLSETKAFDGTVQFIFQPAEEGHGGGRAMVDDGLFRDFPVDQVYGMHNWPELPVGEFAVMPGPIMAAADRFAIKITGKGGHAAKPHCAIDPILIGAQIVMAVQTIASRTVDPAESVVVTVAQFHGGSADNVIPGQVSLTGTVRSFKTDVQDIVEPTLRRIVAGIAMAHGAEAEVSYARGYPPTINSVEESEIAAQAIVDLVGADRLRRDMNPSMGAEDFSFMLAERPGSYIWIGNGGGVRGSLHHPNYDFNDEILTLGASYWARLVERTLPRL